MPGKPDKPATQMLEYGHHTRLAWVSRHRRRLILTAVIFAIAAPIWWNWPSLKGRILWLYWSRQAAAHVMPSSIKRDVTGLQATQLAASNPDYIVRRTSMAAKQPLALYRPRTLQNLTKFDSRIDPLVVADDPVLFMGTLRRPDGAPRLVILTGSLNMDNRLMFWWARATILSLPGWFDSPPPAATGVFLPGLGRIGGAGPPLNSVSVQSAIIDPVDRSHVVFPYSVLSWSQEIIGKGEIDAYLKNDDTLHLSVHVPGEVYVTEIGNDPLRKFSSFQKLTRPSSSQSGASSLSGPFPSRPATVRN